MIDKATKALMEQDIQDNFKNVTLTVPPDNDQNIRFDVSLQHLTQDTFDKLLESSKNYIVIGMDFPSVDLPWERVIGDSFGLTRSHELEGEQLPAAADWVTVNDPVTATFDFTMTEAVLSKISIYIEKVAGSTSWLRVDLYNENGGLIHVKTFMPSQIPDAGSARWVDIRTWLPVELNYAGPVSGTYTVLFTEIEMGATPTGTKIGKNGLNVAYRTYHGLFADTIGKLNRATLRLNIYAKDKKLEKTPQVKYFMGKDDIVIQTAILLREHVRTNWLQYGLNDIPAMALGQAWNSDISPFASVSLDILVTCPDLAEVVTPTLPMKDIDINVQYGL